MTGFTRVGWSNDYHVQCRSWQYNVPLLVLLYIWCSVSALKYIRQRRYVLPHQTLHCRRHIIYTISNHFLPMSTYRVSHIKLDRVNESYRKLFWEKMLDFFEYYMCILALKIWDNLRWYGTLSTTSVTFSLMSTIYPTNKNPRRTQEYMMDLEYRMSDPSISHDNSCAVEVNVDNLITV